MQAAMQQMLADPGVRQAMEQQVGAACCAACEKLSTHSPACWSSMADHQQGTSKGTCTARDSGVHGIWPAVTHAACLPAQMSAVLSTPEGRAQMSAMLEASPMYQRCGSAWRIY